MAFSLPPYRAPDFTRPPFPGAPPARFVPVTKAGVAPENYHATSIYPEYFQVAPGEWLLPADSRMDCVVVLERNGSLSVREFRLLQPGDVVCVGRSENCGEGIYVHTEGFEMPAHVAEKFAFRTLVTRETSFSIDYDEMYDLLAHERDHGFILWVLGPAVVFDRDAREAFAAIIRTGFCHGLLAGNALGAHDIEGALYQTALGQEIYSKRQVPLGHYHHLDALNTVRGAGSIVRAIETGLVKNGIMHAAVTERIPYVLAGSIRDDGPLPEVTADVYAAQDRMRSLARRATTVICMATQLHAIATGNMTPSYRVLPGEVIRPVYFYSVDMSEFATSKLTNRGSLTARSILTNVQDFIVTLERGLRKRLR